MRTKVGFKKWEFYVDKQVESKWDFAKKCYTYGPDNDLNATWPFSWEYKSFW